MAQRRRNHHRAGKVARPSHPNLLRTPPTIPPASPSRVYLHILQPPGSLHRHPRIPSRRRIDFSRNRRRARLRPLTRRCIRRRLQEGQRRISVRRAVGEGSAGKGDDLEVGTTHLSEGSSRRWTAYDDHVMDTPVSRVSKSHRCVHNRCQTPHSASDASRWQSLALLLYTSSILVRQRAYSELSVYQRHNSIAIPL